MEIPEGSQTEIQMDEDKHKLILSADKKFELKSENHIFESLGLADVSESDLEQFIDRELFEYLRSSRAVSADKPVAGQGKSPQKTQHSSNFTPVLLQGESMGSTSPHGSNENSKELKKP